VEEYLAKLPNRVTESFSQALLQKKTFRELGGNKKFSANRVATKSFLQANRVATKRFSRTEWQQKDFRKQGGNKNFSASRAAPTLSPSVR
jgi:hypothetical protein